jgi:hypothetical protein
MIEWSPIVEVAMSSNKSSWLGTSASVVCLVLGGPAAASWVHQGERLVSFKGVGPGGLGIEGKGTDVSLKEHGESLVATVGLRSITTGIDLRDRHMTDKYLETTKYPYAVFTVEKSKVKSPGEGDIEGKLQLHGVSRTIRISYKASGSNKQALVTGSAQLNMKDFNIAVPSYLGVTMKPEVTVSFRLGAVDR